MTVDNIENAHLRNQLKPFLPPNLALRLDLDEGMSLEDARSIYFHIDALRTVLSSYLPRYLVSFITENPEPGLVSAGLRHGAVMFADVLGFTAISEKLSEFGKEGAEEITGIVNDYFDSMLMISGAFGGELLKFGGDALLNFFEDPDGPERALVAGQAMQEAMSRFAEIKTPHGVFQLRMKIGMAYGPVFLASLGNAIKMDYAIMGRALTKMAQAEKMAAAGQIVVDQSMRNATRSLAAYTQVADGFWSLQKTTSRLSPDQAPGETHGMTQTPSRSSPRELIEDCLPQVAIIEALSPYVPEELLSQLMIDPRRPILYGSHRPVTVMFANFYGLDEIFDTLAPEHGEAIIRILNPYFVTTNEIISRFGGTVNRLDSYTNGQRILALFGALRAHENDPQRAVQAALELNNSLKQVNLQASEELRSMPDFRFDPGRDLLKQRIGINSGFVFAGNAGSARRREYTVMGGQVNLTARLMGIARDGEILIGQSTARQTANLFVMDEKEPVSVKGFSQPVRNFVVSDIRQRPRWRTDQASSPMVGREEEFSAGKLAIERAKRGDGCVLVINGVSGIGKTRLAEELTQFGESVGLDLLVGSCLSYGKTMTYHPWTEIFRAYFGIKPMDESQSSQLRAEAIRHGMEVIGEALWAPVIGAVLGLDIPDNDLTRGLDAKLRRQRVLDLTVKLLQSRAQERPLMLVIEDAHWADPASIDLINYVIRNVAGHPVLVILLHRLDEGLPDWTSHAHSIELSLGDLPEGACRQILDNMIGPIQLSEKILQTLHSKACGNPLFIVEVVHALIDTGALQQDQTGAWKVAEELTMVELPDTIHGMIISRIDRLQAMDRQLLEVASVVGQVFTCQTLKGVYPYRDFDVDIQERLSYLTKIGLTEIQNPVFEIYRFIHLTTQEVVYQSLSYGLRRKLHRDIGDFVERTFANALGEQTNLLAHHYFEGQAWEKALGYNLKAGQNAQREFANETAIAAYQRVLLCASKLGAKMDTAHECMITHESLGEVLMLAGRYDEALENYHSARDFIENAPRSLEGLRHLADLCRKTAEVYERQSEYELAFGWLDQGLGCIGEDELSVEAAKIYLLGTGIYRRQGNNDAALNWCQKSLKIASQMKTYDGQKALGHAYYTLSGIHWRRGEYNLALEFGKKSVQLYEQINDIVGLADAYNNLSNAYADLGDWNHAVENLQKSLAIKEKIGDVFYQAALANNLAEIYRDQGNWDQAIQLYERSNAICKQIGATLFDALTLSNLAQVQIYKEDWPAAYDSLIRAQNIFGESGSEDYLSELERRWGEYYLKTGNLAQALAHINRSIELAEDQEALLDQGLALRILGEIHGKTGRFEGAQKSLQRSLQILKDLGSEYEAAKTMLLQIRLALQMGREADRSQLENTRQTFEKLGAQADLREVYRLDGESG